jgi:N-methylhydantoinase B
MDEIGWDNLEPGDAIILNDPYKSGTHLPDVTLVSPIFYQDELVGFAATRAHHLDIGGTVPGSFYAHATENYQEGLRIPAVKLSEAGRLSEPIMKMILANVRLPYQMRTDLQSQISANETGARRFQELMDRYGKDTVQDAMEEIMAYSERRVRKIIEEWPDGEYVGADYADNDGIIDEPIKVQITLRVSGDSLEVDFTGTSPQAKGPANAVPGYANAGVYMVVQAATDPTIPPNDGVYRPVKIIAPKGTIVNPVFPAPCTGGNEICHIIENAMFNALSKIPRGEKAPVIQAGDHGSSNNLFIAGVDPRNGQQYVTYEYPEGGWGGLEGKDGLSAVFSIVGNTWNIPAEVVEIRFPIRIERYELVQDSGGPGKWRGGLGVRRDYRVIDHEAQLSFVGNRCKKPPFGLYGGQPGGPARYVLDPDTPEERLASPVLESKGSMIQLEPETVVSQDSAGGGGYGDPLDRDPERVLKDVVEEYVSLTSAEADYGVVIDPETLALDVEATQKLRARKRKLTADRRATH